MLVEEAERSRAEFAAENQKFGEQVAALQQTSDVLQMLENQSKPNNSLQLEVDEVRQSVSWATQIRQT